MITEADIGWTAGIIDGEGSIGVYIFDRKNRPNPAWRLQLRVSNNDTRILYRLQELWGGKILKEGSPRKETHNQTYNWVVYGKKACEILRVIQGQLTSKGEQASLALDFGQLLTEKRGKSSKLSNENLGQREEIALRLRIAKGRKVG